MDYKVIFNNSFAITMIFACIAISSFFFLFSAIICILENAITSIKEQKTKK